MKMNPVTSSTIEAIGHNDDSTMQVQFKNGNIYEYSNIAKELYNSIINAESVGKQFASCKAQGLLNQFTKL